MSTQIKTQKIKKTKVSDIFFLAAIAFLLFLIEPVLIALIGMRGFGLTIAARAICIVAWVFCAKGLINTAKKECGWDMLDKKNAPSALQWALVSVITAAVVAYFVWNKYYVITSNITSLTTAKNIIAFSSMILLNAFKAIAITLFLAFVQKGCELSFKAGKWLPLGGVALGIIWAIMFILSGSAMWGSPAGFDWFYSIYQFAFGLVCGIVFVATGNRARYAFPFMVVISLFMFLS